MNFNLPCRSGNAAAAGNRAQLSAAPADDGIDPFCTPAASTPGENGAQPAQGGPGPQDAIGGLLGALAAIMNAIAALIAQLGAPQSPAAQGAATQPEAQRPSRFLLS